MLSWMPRGGSRGDRGPKGSNPELASTSHDPFNTISEFLLFSNLCLYPTTAPTHCRIVADSKILRKGAGAFVPEKKETFERLFRSGSPEELRAMAQSFNGFHLLNEPSGDIRGATVSRKRKDANQAGFVYFALVLGEWLIMEM